MDLRARGTDFAAFWTERRLCFLAGTRPDGSVHLVPVGVTLDLDAGLARVICSRSSYKARNLARGGVRVAAGQVEGGRWSTVEGVAVVTDDPERVAEAVRRYAERYRTPRPNADRVAVEITVDRVLGNA